MSEESNTNLSLSTSLEEIEETSEPSQAAITIVIQSWATPILSILMLAMGLVGGYFGRPLIDSSQTTSVSEANQPSDSATEIAPTPDADLAAQQQELMAMVVGETRHFQGNPNAPVTIIEFSDFK